MRREGNKLAAVLGSDYHEVTAERLATLREAYFQSLEDKYTVILPE